MKGNIFGIQTSPRHLTEYLDAARCLINHVMPQRARALVNAIIKRDMSSERFQF